MNNYKDYKAGDYERVVDCNADNKCNGYKGKILNVNRTTHSVFFENEAGCGYRKHFFKELEPVEDKQEKSADEKVKDYLERAHKIGFEKWSNQEMQTGHIALATVEIAKMLQREELE